MGDKKGGDPMTALRFILEKAHMFEDLRDEIYCQLCKQLTQNPNKYASQKFLETLTTRESKTKGWELMAVCCSIFSPTNFFVKHLASFLISQVHKIIRSTYS